MAVITYAVFFFFAAVAVIFAIVVIAHRNPVVGALSLVASFFALAVMYVLLDAPFLAALQVIVYAGAIMVLFLFVIMLLNLQKQREEPTRPIQQFLGYTGSAGFGGGDNPNHGGRDFFDSRRETFQSADAKLGMIVVDRLADVLIKLRRARCGLLLAL